MKYKVSFRPEAETDLFSLYNYIANESGRQRAGDYIGRIEAACMKLATFLCVARHATTWNPAFAPSRLNDGPPSFSMSRTTPRASCGVLRGP